MWRWRLEERLESIRDLRFEARTRDRGQMSEIRGQRAEDRGQRAELGQ